VILIVSKSDNQSRFSAHPPPVGFDILTGDGERGGVVMQFLQGDIELLDHVQNEVGQQSTAVCIEKTIQGTSDAVIGELSGGAAKERREEGGSPFADRVQGGRGDDETAQQSAEGQLGIKAGAWVRRGKALCEQGGEAQAGEEVVDQGESGDRFGIQVEGGGLWHGVDISFVFEYNT
jgi:hypothetical protein